MALTVDDQGVFQSLQLRSSTPGANEKVLNFLQGMRSVDGEIEATPPRSMIGAEDAAEMRRAESVRSGQTNNNNINHNNHNNNGSSQTVPQIYSPVPRSRASDTLINPNNGGGGMMAFSPRSGVKSHKALIQEVVENEDARSDEQEGMRSELGEAVQQQQHHEPGPNDPPGPKYESYDSGPSFGNFGPLPVATQEGANPYARGSWNPVWTDLVQTAEVKSNGGAASEKGTPRQTAANTLPPTSSPQPSHTRPASDLRPLSPLSARTRLSAYPPLPESRMGDRDRDSQYEGPSSPTAKSRAPRSKAPSISPSESPSQRVHMFAPKSPFMNGNGTRSPPPASVMSGGVPASQSRPFSAYRHTPTQEDLLNAAMRGRALVIPQEPEKEPSVASKSSPSKIAASRESRALSKMEGGRPPSSAASRVSRASRPESQRQPERDMTPTPSRPHSPDGFLDAEETRIVNEALARTPRTSVYAAAPLEPDVAGHYHDMELCVLLHQENDANQHEFVKKALRKAVRQRIKKLGMKYDHESIKQYRKSYHDHDPAIHLRPEYSADDTPPQWASDLKRELVLMQQRIESLGPKIDNLKVNERERSFNGGGGSARDNNNSRFMYDDETRTPQTQTVNIQTQQTGTMADSMYQGLETRIDDDGNVHDYEEGTETGTERGNNGRGGHYPHTDGETRSAPRSLLGASELGRDDSPGQQYLEEELYKLRQKPHGSQHSHKSWEVAQHDDEGDDHYGEDMDNDEEPISGLPTIPDMNGDTYHRNGSRASSPPLPALPDEAREMAVHPQGPWNAVDLSGVVGEGASNQVQQPQQQQLAPWQRIHARLLNWAIIWPSSELENALNSTTRAQQVDEVALSIWSTQAYKRYVRARLTDSPKGVVDRLFVPPNMADAINNAVFNGRHGDACGMLRDLWTPFGLEGTPRLIVVLAKHRSDPGHWVVHRFSLPDGSLTTYDSYPERTLPDGRPLGWWFAIRVAWPNTMYPSPDHLVQKMVRLHRPLQLPIDNSVAAAGIWRNVLMGSRAERSVDLERLRDLINTEVKNLKQRKVLGKLSIGAPRPAWEDMS